MKQKSEKEITRQGNPAKPQGIEGAQMLQRMNRSHHEVTQWALRFFDFEPNQTALDIGCGGGNTISLLSEQSEKVYGIDYSEVSVQESLQYNQTLVSQGRVVIQQGNVAQLPFDNDFFDKITTIESFYFWPDPQEDLKEVYRVLKENGTFLMVCDVYKKPGLSQDILNNVDRYNLFITDEEGYEELFLKAGFKEVQIHTKEGTDWICVEARK